MTLCKVKNGCAHKQEYARTTKKIRHKREHGLGGQTSPHGFARFVQNALNQSCSMQTFLGHMTDKVRKTHDFYGWKASDLCHGAIYRSNEFMSINMDDRCGANGCRDECSGIHIEHTIPNNVILETLWASKDYFIRNNYSLECIHEFFMMISVCTALTRHEERGHGNVKKVIQAGLGSSHPQLEDGRLHGIPSLKNLKPFVRYDFGDGLQIYEMINGTRIRKPKEWTLKDHIELLNLHDVYKWQTINNGFKS